MQNMHMINAINNFKFPPQYLFKKAAIKNVVRT